jgi:hypothetical protein
MPGSPLRRLAFPALLLTAALSCPPPAAFAEGPAPAALPDSASQEVALQRALDQTFTLNFQRIELGDAFKRIAGEAKISLSVDPACYDLLPYGSTTRVSADFRQSRVRDALEEVLLPLALTQTTASGTVMIQPSNPLMRIGRRADLEELKLLQELRTGQDLRPAQGGTFNLTDAIRTAMDGRKDLVISMPAEGDAAALEQVRRQLPMSPYRALELYTQLTHQVWFVEAGALFGGPTGGTIRIMTGRQWVERQLDRPIQITASNQPLEDVVAELSHASGVRIVPEPGLYQAVPRINLASNNQTLRGTLEFLAGVTRIAFDVREDSILLHLAPGPNEAGAGTAKSDAYVGRIAVPVGNGMQMDLLVRESDLPPEVNDLRKRRLQEVLDGLGRSLAAPPVPATAPATHPAETQAAK